MDDARVPQHHQRIQHLQQSSKRGMERSVGGDGRELEAQKHMKHA